MQKLENFQKRFRIFYYMFFIVGVFSILGLTIYVVNVQDQFLGRYVLLPAYIIFFLVLVPLFVFPKRIAAKSVKVRGEIRIDYTGDSKPKILELELYNRGEYDIRIVDVGFIERRWVRRNKGSGIEEFKLPADSVYKLNKIPFTILSGAYVFLKFDFSEVCAEHSIAALYCDIDEASLPQSRALMICKVISEASKSSLNEMFRLTFYDRRLVEHSKKIRSFAKSVFIVFGVFILLVLAMFLFVYF